MSEIDLVLSDRLRELGMDYVADVMEGKRQPSQWQAMFLQTGRTMPRRRHEGTLLIGGVSDGDRVRSNPETMRRLQVPMPAINERLLYQTPGPMPTSTYIAERIAVFQDQFWFYRCTHTPIERAVGMLFENYESPNAVYR